MRPRSDRIADSAEKTVRDIRRATRRHFSAEDKILIVLEDFRGEDSIAALCRVCAVPQNLPRIKLRRRGAKTILTLVGLDHLGNVG